MGDQTYFGFSGGLYPNGSNSMPDNHAQAGMEHAAQIMPRNHAGRPNPNGKYILMSFGMSNTMHEFCAQEIFDGISCDDYSFIGKSAALPAVNHDNLLIINGARGGQSAEKWVSPDDFNYRRIQNQILTPLELSVGQVQIGWLKVTTLAPTISLPDENADAYTLVRQMGEIARTLKQIYPNMQQLFISSRTYGGYGVDDRNPEPFAYETGLAVKWVIEAQIHQMETGEIDPLAGDLNDDTVAPWLAWGPYLWANGLTPRSDGLVWYPDDFRGDGVHPSKAGVSKVTGLLLDFFTHSPFTTCWFLSPFSCRELL